MSFTVAAERARHAVAVDQGGPSFPLIVMSHGNGGTPGKYAPLLERLASHGYVIAASGERQGREQPVRVGDERREVEVESLKGFRNHH